MTDRNRRVRRQISDATDESSGGAESSSGEDYDPRKADAIRRGGRSEPSAASMPSSNRSRRPNTGSTIPTATQRSAAAAAAAEDRRQSLTFTVKAPPSKLREVIRANELDSLHDNLGGGTVLDGPRTARRAAAAAATARTSGRYGDNRPRYAEYAESDIEDDEDEEEDEDENDDEEEEDDEQLNDFEELGAEAEGGTDEDDDVEMDDIPQQRHNGAPKAPKITLRPPAKNDSRSTAKSKIVVTPAKVGPVQSVEDKEMDEDPGDDEVENSSDLSDEEDDATNLNEEDAEDTIELEEEEEDAQGEDEEMEEDDDEDIDDDDESQTDGTPASGMATPDPSKMTKRQRGRPEDQGTLLALDMAPQQRKFFTDAEKAMKKDEHARKRKELTKRKIQEEKNAALNRLLKPQASKARGAAPKPETLAAATAAAGSAAVYDDEIYDKANPLFTRWVNTKDGIRLAVPEEWLGKRVGAFFGPSLSSGNGAFVQEVE